jgi:1-acyl-sn-glycerol-3-phosphate acyltransferase
MSSNKAKTLPPFQSATKTQSFFCAIRTILLRTSLYALSIIWFPVITLMLPFPWRIRSILYRSWCYLSRFLARYICGVKYNIVGLENTTDLNIKDKKSAVYICNHQSDWETVTLPGILTPLCYVLKKELFYIPFFGWSLKLTQHIGIDRSQKLKAMKQVLRDGNKRINQGLSILIFPEGTRTPPFERNDFNKGGAQLAKTAGIPVIPMVVDSGFCWPAKTHIAYPGTVNIIIGKQISTDNKSTNEIHEQTTKWILDHLAELEKRYL